MNLENFIGKKVIVRADRAGVFYGTLAEKEGNEVRLTNCRRLWYWSGAASISQIALEGVKRPELCNFTVTVADIVIAGVIEIIPATEAAQKNIEAVKVWKMQTK